jgi:hypothetical protein
LDCFQLSKTRYEPLQVGVGNLGCKVFGKIWNLNGKIFDDETIKKYYKGLGF